MRWALRCNNFDQIGNGELFRPVRSDVVLFCFSFLQRATHQHFPRACPIRQTGRDVREARGGGRSRGTDRGEKRLMGRPLQGRGLCRKCLINKGKMDIYPYIPYINRYVLGIECVML